MTKKKIVKKIVTPVNSEKWNSCPAARPSNPQKVQPLYLTKIGQLTSLTTTRTTMTNKKLQRRSNGTTEPFAMLKLVPAIESIEMQTLRKNVVG